MDSQLIFEALKRIEDKLDKKADADDLRELEKRVRTTETSLVKIFTLGSVGSALAAYVGVKF